MVAGGALRRAEVPLALAIAVAAAIWARQIQAFQVFRYWDADEYFQMAQQVGAGEPITAAAPYAYRLLAPWMVARCCGGDIQQGFLLLNLAAGSALAVLLVYWLRRFVDRAGIRLLMVTAYALQWHGPLRFAFYYPAYVDPLFQAFLLAALLVGERLADRPSLGAGLLYVGLTMAGTLARETMMMVPVIGLLGAVTVSRLSGQARLIWPVVSMAASVAVFAGARLATRPREGYGFLDAVLLHLTNKPIESLVLVWFISFGPMVAIVLYDWRATLQFLRQRLDLAALPLFCIVLAYIGGHDTERYLFWAMPVMFVLIGRAIERHRRVLAHVAIASVVVAGQVLSQRVLWAVPDPGNAVTALSDVAGFPSRIYAVANRVFVIDDFHWNLWSNFGSRPFHLVQLVFYVALSGLIIVMMRRHSAGRAQARPDDSGMVAS